MSVDRPEQLIDPVCGMTVNVATAEANDLLLEGMRRWYESCSCCLGDTYPEIKAQLDAERAAANAGPVDPGICEVADAPTAVTAPTA